MMVANANDLKLALSLNKMKVVMKWHINRRKQNNLLEEVKMPALVHQWKEFTEICPGPDPTNKLPDN